MQKCSHRDVSLAQRNRTHPFEDDGARGGGRNVTWRLWLVSDSGERYRWLGNYLSRRFLYVRPHQKSYCNNKTHSSLNISTPQLIKLQTSTLNYGTELCESNTLGFIGSNWVVDLISNLPCWDKNRQLNNSPNRLSIEWTLVCAMGARVLPVLSYFGISFSE